MARSNPVHDGSDVSEALSTQFPVPVPQFASQWVATYPAQVAFQVVGVHEPKDAVMRCAHGSVAQAALSPAVALVLPHLFQVHVPVVATVATLLQRRFVWQSAPERHLVLAIEVVMPFQLLD